MFSKLSQKAKRTANELERKLKDLNYDLKTKANNDVPINFMEGIDEDGGPLVDRDLFWSEILSNKYPNNKFLERLATKQDRAYLLKELLVQRKWREQQRKLLEKLRLEGYEDDVPF